MEVTNMFQRLSFGKGQIDSDKIEKISKIINNKITLTEPLTQQEKYLLYLFQKDEVDLKNAVESDLAIYILKKILKQDIEINFLQKLIEGIDLFKKKPELLTRKTTNKKILESLQLEEYKANQVLFNMGDTGSLYYIVLQGSVNVLINDPNQSKTAGEIERANDKVVNKDKQDQQQEIKEEKEKKEGDNDNPENSDSNDSTEEKIQETKSPKKSPKKQQQQLEKPKQNFKKSLTMLLKGNFQAVEDNKEFLKENFPNMICVKTYQPGESFGEIALITTTNKRTATCIAQTDCQLMTLSKTAFQDIMGAYSQQMKEENVRFLRQFSFLQDLPSQKLLSIFHLLTEHNLQNKQVLYSENEPAKELYFIRKGEIEISKVQQFENEYEKEHVKIKRAFKKQKEENGLNEINKQKQNRKINKRVPIVIIGANSYFGEDEILYKQNKRNSMAKAVSETVVYSIEKNKLVQTLKYYNQIKIFIEDIKMKTEWHNKRLESVGEAQKTKFLLQDKKFSRRFSQMSQKSSKSQESDSEEKENTKNLDLLYQNQQLAESSQRIQSYKKRSLLISPTQQLDSSDSSNALRRFSVKPSSTKSFNNQTQNSMSNSNYSQTSQTQVKNETSLPSFKLLQKYHQAGTKLSSIIFNTQIEEQGAEQDCTPMNQLFKTKKEQKSQFDQNNQNNFMSTSENSPVKKKQRSNQKIIKNNSKRNIINVEKIQQKKPDFDLEFEEENIKLESSFENYPKQQNQVKAGSQPIIPQINDQNQKQIYSKQAIQDDGSKTISYAQKSNLNNALFQTQTQLVNQSEKLKKKSFLQDNKSPKFIDNSFNCLQVKSKSPNPFLEKFNTKIQNINDSNNNKNNFNNFNNNIIIKNNYNNIDKQSLQKVKSLTQVNFYNRNKNQSRNNQRITKESPSTEYQQFRIPKSEQNQYRQVQNSSQSLENKFYLQKMQKYTNQNQQQNKINFSTDYYTNGSSTNGSLFQYGLQSGNQGKNQQKQQKNIRISQNQIYQSVKTDQSQYLKQTSSSQNKNRYLKLKEKQNEMEKENKSLKYIYDFQDFYQQSKIINVNKINQKSQL